MLGRRIVGVVMTGLIAWGAAGCDATEADLVQAVARIDGTDSGTGTWDDSVSGLTWQNPPYKGKKTWSDAKSYCASLSLAGGGWRLPTISELRSLIRGCADTQTGGSCGVTDSCLSRDWCEDSSCESCSSGAGPAIGCFWPDEMVGTCWWYWSSSLAADEDSQAFYVGFGYGGVGSNIIFNDSHVRCVR